ncbi:hypothetical protein SELMODRAFT_417047 [Selaginella moellendorffii]|uniref:Uncharacterized protein n=1 Tax=Selaginella moellendorffii TaxID=88036 RepID=D8S171_SELML|nr:hypothetical protein SELMODRAFT_417047 [Selaginella moellendorffii]
MSYYSSSSSFGAADSMPKSAQQQLESLPDPSDRDQDDDFVAGLVEQMAHSMLDEEECGGDEGYPATTAAATPLWPPLHETQRRSGWSSTKSSPSPAVSPPTPLHHFGHESELPPPRGSDAWELLHLAAQEVMRLKMGGGGGGGEIRAYNRAASMYHSIGTAKNSGIVECCGSKPVGCAFGQQQLDWKQQQQQRSTQRHYQNALNPAAGIVPVAWNRRARSPRSLQQQQQQARHIASSRNLHQTSSTRSSNIHHSAGSSLFSSQWPAASSVKSHTTATTANGGTGMRAVFLRGPGFGSSTSNGTGVFLPQATAPTASSNRDPQKRKPPCSTVLLPSRIVEVLNLNVDDLECQPHPSLGTTDHSSSDDYLSVHLSKSYSACSPTRWHSTAEHALPTEWTY